MTRTIAWFAAISVLSAVAWHQISGAQNAFDRDYAATVRSAIERKDWTAATHAAHAALRLRPEERRIHAYLSEVQLNKGLPQQALQHLSLAAAPVPKHAPPLMLDMPTQPELRAALDRITAQVDATVLPATDHLRFARVVAALADTTQLVAAIQRAAQSALVDAPHAPHQRNFLAATLGVEATHLATLSDKDIARAIAPVTHREIEPAIAPLAAFAGGSYFSGTHAIAMNSNTTLFPANDAWTLLSFDNATATSPRITPLQLVPLSNESQSIADWLAALPEGAYAIGLVSPEALAITSNEAIDAWRSQAGLVAIPKPDAYRAYAFVLLRVPGGWKSMERAAVTFDEPAILEVGPETP
ncbi:MAG TPA: hypothetical protein PLJ47_01800 [Candidatus Hydrogenedentes bacterium]|nr:hypothetical protein [Candidatus Hydrogenedentota bacterium]HRK33299.1 hypothetical protein [Candidatus Hydrogenedentota bacterium]